MSNHNTMQLSIVDSEKEIFSGNVEFLVAPACEGEIGIYPNHIAFISTLKPGVLRFQLPEQSEQSVFSVSGGFLEVSQNRVTVLADIVERTDALDEARLIEQRDKALAEIKRSSQSGDASFAKLQSTLEIAIAQLKAIDYMKKNSRRA